MNRVRRTRRGRLGPGTPEGPRDAGTTLVELVVATALVAVVVLLVAVMSIGFARTSAQTVARQQQVDVAREAVEAVSRSLRSAVLPRQLATSCDTTCTSAPAVVVAGTRTLVVRSDLDDSGGTAGPSLVTYAFTTGADGDELVETVQVPDSVVPGPSGWTYCDTAAVGATAECQARAVRRVLARGVVPGTTFTYFADPTSLVPLADTGSGLAAAVLPTVQAVEVRVTVQSRGAVRANPSTAVQRVLLTNVRNSLRGG